MKIYTIIGGVNGCGKSSLTGSIKAERTDLGIIVDPDKITAELGGDEYEGGKVAVEKLQRALADGVSFTQETTLSGGYARKLARRAKEAGYYIRLYYVGLDSLQESLQRIENRVRKGGHDIPRRDVEARFARRALTGRSPCGGVDRNMTRHARSPLVPSWCQVRGDRRMGLEISLRKRIRGCLCIAPGVLPSTGCFRPCGAFQCTGGKLYSYSPERRTAPRRGLSARVWTPKEGFCNTTHARVS